MVWVVMVVVLVTIVVAVAVVPLMPHGTMHWLQCWWEQLWRLSLGWLGKVVMVVLVLLVVIFPT